MTGDERHSLPSGVAAWAAESRLTPREQPMADARAAMHAAAAAPPAAIPGRSSRILPALRAAGRHHPLRLGTATLVAAASLLVALGWDAPAGSPLHEVRIGREQVGLILAAGDARTALRLSYAESRLRDAKAGIDPQGSLGEAAGLLDQARAALPAGHDGELWQRWTGDEATLRALRAGSSDDGGRSRSGDGLPAPGGAPGGDDRGGTAGGGESSGATASPGGGGDGGHSGGDGVSSSTSSAASSGDGGGSGDDGGGRSGSTSSSSSTSSTDGGGHDSSSGSSGGSSSSSSTTTTTGGGSSDH